jgi:hypothetical protein
MRRTYQILAWTVAAEVVVQAATVAWFMSGLHHWVTQGGTLDNALIESEEVAFPEIAGVIVHGINGAIVVPAIGLILLIVSFFARIPGGVKWAAGVFGLVVLQILLAFLSFPAPVVGILHGINAFALAGLAGVAGRRAAAAPAVGPDREAATTA